MHSSLAVTGSQKFREPSPTKALRPMYLLSSLVTGQLQSTHLNLADAGLADEGFKMLLDLPPTATVMHAEFRGNRITSNGLESVVTFIRKCGNVENLGLSWNDLENDSLAGLMSLDHLMNDAGVCKVAFLDLRNCNLSLNSKDLLASIVKSP